MIDLDDVRNLARALDVDDEGGLGGVAARNLDDCAFEIEKLNERLALWEKCAQKSIEMYGGCIRPEYEKALQVAAISLAGLVRITKEERDAIKEASEFYIGTRAGVVLSGLLERLSPSAPKAT